MKKILLIEDNADMRENTMEILELANYKVYGAENGRIGVEKAKEILPDLIVCDIMMPELDGYGVLYILSKLPETARIPFIFLSAKAEKSDMRKGMNMGADDYLTKPFEEFELLDAVESRFRRNEIVLRDFERSMSGLSEFVEEARGLVQLEGLSKDRKLRVFKKKEVVYREGDYANYLYFISKGSVKTVKTDDYGKDLVTNLYSEGDFIGFMSLLEGSEYSETASVLEDVELAVIPKKDFLELIHGNRDVSAAFIRILANNVKEKESRLLELAYSPVRERVARALLRLKHQFPDKHPGDEGIRFSREDMAAMVGTATESLIRQLSDFKEEGLIKVTGREINILDEVGLEKIIGVS